MKKNIIQMLPIIAVSRHLEEWNQLFATGSKAADADVSTIYKVMRTEQNTVGIANYNGRDASGITFCYESSWTFTPHGLRNQIIIDNNIMMGI